MLSLIAGAAFSGGQSENTGKSAKIGVALYEDAGPAVTAVKNYLGSLSGTLKVEYVYTVLTVTDEATNLSKIQELIAAGVDGIILTMDLGTTAIMEECAAAGVYVAGYLNDFAMSFNMAHDAVFGNEYFLGSSADGQLPTDVTIGTTMFESLLEYNKSNAAAPLTHVSFVIFPAWAFPSQMIAVQQFQGLVAEYNKTAAVKITADPLNEDTDVIPFQPVNSTYFTRHPGIQAIISFAAGSSFVYPSMLQAGKVDIKLFTTGFTGDEGYNFGSTGTGTFQQVTLTQAESATFALVLLLNKINGKDFPDMPSEPGLHSTSQIIINSDADWNIFKDHSMLFDGAVSKAMFTPEEVLNMTAYANPKATYADLVNILGKMTIEDLNQ